MKVAIRITKDRALDIIDIKVYKNKDVADEVDGYDDFYSDTYEREVIENE